MQIIPLVQNLQLPRLASPRTRNVVPPGYGVQEQCLPFTAAAGLGLVIPSPIEFGHCPAQAVPDGCVAFRSPIRSIGPTADWVFFVRDDARCGFVGNAYRIEHPAAASHALEPGISFFDRDDQQDLFKLHLPYVWRTPADMDVLFVSLLNRSGPGLEVLAGLVETDWYASPVNLVLRVSGTPVHVHAGDDLAQAILIARQQRHPEYVVAPSHARVTRDAFNALREWQAHHARDRSAYKVLARSHQGRLE
jgi:hypothetical protein